MIDSKQNIKYHQLLTLANDIGEVGVIRWFGKEEDGVESKQKQNWTYVLEISSELFYIIPRTLLNKVLTTKNINTCWLNIVYYFTSQFFSFLYDNFLCIL